MIIYKLITPFKISFHDSYVKATSVAKRLLYDDFEIHEIELEPTLPNIILLLNKTSLDAQCHKANGEPNLQPNIDGD